MPARTTSDQAGLTPHYRVQVALSDVLLHFASWSPPVLQYQMGELVDVSADWITDSDYGDTIGYIDWTAVTDVTWRYSAKNAVKETS